MYKLVYPPNSFSDLQDVQQNSPASQAGLISNTDYIIGADSILHEVGQIHISLLYKNVLLMLCLGVFGGFLFWCFKTVLTVCTCARAHFPVRIK